MLLKMLLTALMALNVMISCRGELFTALADLEDLLDTESVVIRTLDKYISAQEVSLQKLKKISKEYHREHNFAEQDYEKYVSNPINAYLLTKRLTKDWKEVETIIIDDIGKQLIKNITINHGDLKFPSEEDLTGAAVALMRLQDTYNLETSSLARGELNGVQYSNALSAGDCFEIGKHSYNNGDFYHTALWMKEALSKYEKEQNKTTDKADVLEYLAFSTYQQGYVRSALSMTNELLELSPSHDRAIGNKVHYEREISYLDDLEVADDGEHQEIVQNKTIMAMRKPPVLNEVPGKELYEKLCRGEITLSSAKASQLRCRYETKNHPFLLIAPHKLEEVYKKPYIVVFHDVIYDAEIEVLKELAHPRLERASIHNSETGRVETAHYRISKSAWLKDDEHKHVAAISQRVEDMTGLTARTAEQLQVVNYGIGGHYEPHFDFARKEDYMAEEFKKMKSGNRIATVLFYMSDVEQGGATVFPSLRTAIQPKKGAAVFWYNLYPGGERDYQTRHAGCPVLAGSKWVSNKWLHESGQEFLRPCNLKKEYMNLYVNNRHNI